MLFGREVAPNGKVLALQVGLALRPKGALMLAKPGGDTPLLK